MAGAPLLALREWLSAHPARADVLVAVAVFVVVVLVPHPDHVGAAVVAPLTTRPVLVAAVTCAFLALRRGRALVVLAVTVLGAVTATVLVAEPTLLVLAPLVALYTVAVTGGRRTTLLAWAGTALSLAAVEALTRPVPDPQVLSSVALTALAASVGAGVAHRRAYLAAVEDRAERAERGREEEARHRVVEERLRIARELHDVVAHHMAVVSVQAGVASYLLPDQPVAAQEALGHVRRAASGILDELGGILDVLRQGDEPGDPTKPAPGLAQLDGLVDSFTAAGLVVDRSVSGRPQALAAGVDLVAHRVLQEALTNAHKHGTGTARVRITYLREEVQLDVSNPLPDRTPGPTGVPDGPSDGYGLLGMRERASAVGGVLRHGAEGESFHVHAVLPLPVAA